MSVRGLLNRTMSYALCSVFSHAPLRAPCPCFHLMASGCTCTKAAARLDCGLRARGVGARRHNRGVSLYNPVALTRACAELPRSLVQIDMDHVTRYLDATDQSPISNAYFLDPIMRTMGNLVRPPMRKQKFYRREISFPCPPAVWERLAYHLPTVDSRLGIRRMGSYDGMWGKLKPTKVTDSAKIYHYEVPPGRVSVVEDLVMPAMKKHFAEVSSGGARLGRVRKAQMKRGVRASSITLPTGPLLIEYRQPTSLVAKRRGAIGRLKIGFYVATMSEDLYVTYSEHSGYRKGKSVVKKVRLKSRVRVAIRKALLQRWKEKADERPDMVPYDIHCRLCKALGEPAPTPPCSQDEEAELHPASPRPPTP